MYEPVFHVMFRSERLHDYTALLSEEHILYWPILVDRLYGFA